MRSDARGLRRVPGGCFLLRFPSALRIRGGTPKVDPELVKEIAAEPKWMYPWEVAPGLVAPVHADMLPLVHQSRLMMMEEEVRDVLAAAGGDARVLDLACNEGWFGHRMLDLGASRVVGIDIREVNIRRARLIAEEMELADRLEFQLGDVFELDPKELGTFDVVLLLGLIYHVENPVGAVRVAQACTKSLCVIESQLTRQRDPILWGMGEEDNQLAPASFAAYREVDSEVNPLASTEGVLSFVPNQQAVEEMCRVAGFRRVEMVEPPSLAHPYYIRGDRGEFLAWN